MASHNYRYLEQDFEDQSCGLGGLTCALVVTRSIPRSIHSVAIYRMYAVRFYGSGRYLYNVRARKTL